MNHHKWRDTPTFTINTSDCCCPFPVTLPDSFSSTMSFDMCNNHTSTNYAHHEACFIKVVKIAIWNTVFGPHIVYKFKPCVVTDWRLHVHQGCALRTLPLHRHFQSRHITLSMTHVATHYSYRPYTIRMCRVSGPFHIIKLRQSTLLSITHAAPHYHLTASVTFRVWTTCGS